MEPEKNEMRELVVFEGIIEIGRCYRTGSNQVRKVVAFNDAAEDSVERIIVFQTRGSWNTMDWPYEHEGGQSQGENAFRADVEEEVGCDWDIRYTKPPPS